jgi:hypothetical protein
MEYPFWRIALWDSTDWFIPNPAKVYEEAAHYFEYVKALQK